MVFGDHVIGKERLGLASGSPASRFLSFLSLRLSLSSAFRSLVGFISQICHVATEVTTAALRSGLQFGI